MNIFHLSMECFPVAKVGGLADVVGALPKYQNKFEGIRASVVMPWYNKPFVHNHDFEPVFNGFIHQGPNMLSVHVMKERSSVLGFDLYLVHIPGLLDRDNPYGYRDESYQFLAFQHAVLHWLTAMKIRPDVLHCHDYHTGLVPFMLQHCPEFSPLQGVKTIGTIHNGEYQGQMRWEMLDFFPWIDGTADLRILDWDGWINPLATMIKCCHAFNAVSGGYLEELFQSFKGLESLVRQEHAKAYGIINGIDTEVWDPATDDYLDVNYSTENAREGKWMNKVEICREYGLNPELPLVGFIGRFAGEKGADLLPDIIWQSIQQTYGALNIIVLGSGEKHTEHRLAELAAHYSNFALDLGYKEYLSHQIYASADFLLMPSRVEPCGLNQMYAMRYGTIPVVRYTGGLRDTVQDISSGGAGLNFGQASAEDAVHALKRAAHIYHDQELMNHLIQVNMNFNFSWHQSAENYLNLYRN
ncbi:glycogen synthase [Chryseobacterium sp. MFBS3-17]|uniref:glycogen synthase n=1 Tax=Chryseobacterium sp. MFBS3-17 TaxID=2886689 RepID=UPI001D0F2045|nr:glycogen/starch synthase [Chryseobacterium sp. MFBS3-17]MCC2590281.1 glycogen synthase [Chryseobacterium sp. MFBS3-17]